MPVSILAAFISAGIAGTVAATVAAGTFTLGFSLAAFASAAVLGGITKLTQKNPSSSGATMSAGSAQRTLTVRQAASPWQIIVGECKVGGVLTYVEVTSDNQYWHLIITFAGHQCAAFKSFYFNDDLVPIDGSGNAVGKYAGYARIKTNLGNPADASQPFPDLVTESAGFWTNDHLQRGRCKAYIRLVNNGDIFPSGIPNISAIIQGTVDVTDARDSSTKWTNNAALLTTWYLGQQTFGVGSVFPSEFQTDYTVSEANVCDERVLLTDQDTTFTADASTDALTLAEDSRRPQVGDGVRVSTDGSLPGGLSADTTYYVITAEAETVKLASTYADSILGNAISLSSAGSGTHTLHYWDEPRYRVNGAFLTAEKPKAVIERLAATMAGRAVIVGGKWHVFSGAYSAPTITLNENHFAGGLELTSHVSRRDNCNGVKGLFTDPSHNWLQNDFPPIKSATYLAEDNNERKWGDLDLTAFCTSISQAQRLAKIELLRMRQGQQISARFKLSAYRAMTGLSLALSFEKFGMTEKAFELTDLKFINNPDGTINVDLSLRETAAAVYDWSTSEESTVDIAPNTNLPDITTVGTPTGVTFTPDDYLVRGEGDLSWTPPSDALVRYYFPEYKKSTDSEWIVLSPVTGTTKRITGLEPGTYNFRVRSQSYFGPFGAYATATVELTAPPVGNVSGLELFEDAHATNQFVGRHAKFVWRHSSTLWADGFGTVTGTGGLEYFWKNYEVQIWVSGSMVRREWITEGEYIYSYEKNVEDNGTPARTFTIKVYKRGRYGQVSPIPAQLTVSNPAPTATAPTVSSIVKGIHVRFARPTDTDWIGFKVWGSTSSGFTADASTLRYSGPDCEFPIGGLETGVAFYYKYCAVDAFGDGSVSSQQVFVPALLVESGDIESGSATNLASAYSSGTVSFSVGILFPTPPVTKWAAPAVQMVSIDIDPDNPSKVSVLSQVMWETDTSADCDIRINVAAFDSKSRYTTGSISSIAVLGGGGGYTTVLTGSGTSWLSANIEVGDIVYLGLERAYVTVISVDSDTQITGYLQPELVGGDAYSGSYIIFIGSGPGYIASLNGFAGISITATPGLSIPLSQLAADGPTTSDPDFVERVYLLSVYTTSTFGTFEVSSRSMQILQSIK